MSDYEYTEEDHYLAYGKSAKNPEYVESVLDKADEKKDAADKD